MNLLAAARQAIAAELAAWQADPLHYAPELRPFVQAHGLAAVVNLAVELSPAIDPALGRPPGYPWQHGLRVARHALRLARAPELAGRAVDQRALFVAGLWHDLAHTGERDDHQQVGAELVRRHLTGHLDEACLAAVARWVAASDQVSAADELEQQILWDANALDLHGAMFVVRGLSYAAVQGVPPEVLLPVFDDLAAMHQAWINQAHFRTTRAWMEQRAEAERRFLRDLAAEIGELPPL